VHAGEQRVGHQRAVAAPGHRLGAHERAGRQGEQLAQASRSRSSACSRRRRGTRGFASRPTPAARPLLRVAQAAQPARGVAMPARPRASGRGTRGRTEGFAASAARCGCRRAWRPVQREDLHQLLERARRVADGEEGRRRRPSASSQPPGARRRSSRTVVICATMAPRCRAPGDRSRPRRRCGLVRKSARSADGLTERRL
jgi:hypothetical protein